REREVSGMELERAALLRIYYFMRLTRTLEERTRTLFLQGRVVGGVYTAQGHEATTVGAAMTLRDGDCIVPQHRELGMHLVRVTSPRAVMCQWLARGNSPLWGVMDSYISAICITVLCRR